MSKRRRLSEDGAYDASPEANSIDEDASVHPKSDKKDQRRSLFVRSLPATVTSEKLAEYFSQSYPIKHATVVQDSSTKTSKGYGFVTFADPEDAQQAVTDFDGSIVDGRKIKVEVAQSRHREIAGEGGKSVPAAKAIEQKAERAKERGDIAPPKLIIRNLPWSIKEPEELALLFRSYGKVKSAVIPKKGPKEQAGFGFVVLRGRKNAEKALEGVNGKEIDGRTLAVDWAVDKKTWEGLQKNEEGNQDNVPGENEDESEVDGDADEDAAAEMDFDAVGEDSSSSSGDISEPLDTGLMEDTGDLESVEDTQDIELEDESIKKENTTTVFVRNLPFTATDESLTGQFTPFGAVRYARVVFDPETERSRGTGFVCFYNEDSARDCVKTAPKPTSTDIHSADKARKADFKPHSILQNDTSDPSGRYTMEGRVLQVSRALNKSAASRKEAEASNKRDIRDRDKRRLYLLSEGTISSSSPLYQNLGPTELNIREASAKQRQKLIKNNATLHLSLTRLSVRNIPRSVTSKDLKALAREAVVGFATDVKAGLRGPLSKEEIARASEEMKVAEKDRKLHGTGIVRQAKIVFEGQEGGKVKEKTGGGRSRGYGFIEYYSHRNALMGLRWLNGHAIKSSGAVGREERQKRLIVEFAIENAQVVGRRKEMEDRARAGDIKQGRFAPASADGGREKRSRDTYSKNRNGDRGNMTGGRKRKREDSRSDRSGAPLSKGSESKKDGKKVVTGANASVSPDEKNKIAKRNRIIAKKRGARRDRKGK